MGARQRGAARHHKKGTGSQKGSPWSQKQSNSFVKVPDLHPSVRNRALLADWQDFSDSNSSPLPRNGFTMSDEARNTERHVNGWGATKLRDQKITFVSAGTLTRDEHEETMHREEENTDVEAASTREKLGQNPVPVLEDEIHTMDTTELTEHLGKAAISDSVNRDESPPQVRTPEPTQRRDSSSSESSEEILFAGRQKAQNIPKIATPPSNPVLNSSPARISESTRTVPDTALTLPKVQPPSTASALSVKVNRKVDRRGRARLRSDFSNEQEAIMADYIANMVWDDDDDDEEEVEDKDGLGPASKSNEHYRFHSGVQTSDVKVQIRSRKRGPLLDQAIDWDSADLEDFDDLSTTDEEVDQVDQILRHRTRPTGFQYLVTTMGQSASDAKWVSKQKLSSQSALQEVRIYEEIRAMKVQETSGYTDTDGDDSESDEDDVLDDLIDDIESEDDENERIMNHTARMTDEQIARALAKQEELGMGGDELLLFDGQVDDDDDDEDDDDFARKTDFIPFSLKKHVSSRGKSKRNRRARDTFPPAEAFADALEQDPYGAFDIMDFDRPSLRPKKKGRKADFPFDLGVDDPDLAEQLRSTWNKDREKKASRKREKLAEREALLLNTAGRNDPASIKAEIRQFLVQESDTLKLAPMDSSLRASVHRLAKSLKLNSRSEGKEGHGIGRFPVLTKTPKTPAYTIDTVWEVDALMNTRKFFPKHGGGSYRGLNAGHTANSARARRGGGGVMSGATYMNGDIVGASAPEIGVDNRGRAMLEKMGWSVGMGIGAVGNKGGVEVIKHVVKTTKAGLG